MTILNALNEVFVDCGLKDGKQKVAGIIAIATTLFFLYTSFFGSFVPMTQRGMLLALVSPMIFLLGGGLKGKFGKVLDIILAIISVTPFAYIMIVQKSLLARGGTATTMDVIMGTIAVLSVMEGCRRRVGNALSIIAGIFLVYAFLGPYMPGVLMHRGMGLETLITACYLGEEGIFGTPVAVTADFIMVFVIFGAFLSCSGAGQFFSDLAQSGFGWMRGGPAKAATVGSALMGMISGSAVANVMTVGNFTIPLMKETGYSSERAGAIEAVASTGGQIMPPVMGAAAFIMAEYLKVSYGTVIVCAAIPAILYYFSLFFMVDHLAAKNKLVGMPREKLPRLKAVMKKSWFLLIPVVVLIGLLGFMDYSPQKSAFAAVTSLLFVSMFAAHTRFNFKKLVKGLVTGAIGGLEVAAVCACAGIVIGVLMRTGLGLSITGILIDVSNGILPVLMILTMICSIILGMGLPTSACYIIVAVLIAPAMVSMGVEPIAAHMFAFFFGCLSAITPPVALAAYASAGIAQSNPMTTGLQAATIGIGAFIIPFAFVYGNELLMIGQPLNILFAFITALLGVYCLSIMVTGYQFTDVKLPFRFVAFATAILLIVPGWQSWVGLAILFVTSAINYIGSKKTPKATIGGNATYVA